MKTKSIYYCQGITDATDKANLYYINVAAAHNMIKAQGEIKIMNKAGREIAVFAY